MNLFISSFNPFIYRLLSAFIVMIALLIGSGEWLLRRHVIPVDLFSKHVDLFNSVTPDYVAFGDSHVARGFSSTMPVYNFGYPSENIEKMNFKMNEFLKKQPSPKRVLLQADPHLFADYRLSVGVEHYPNYFGDKEIWLYSLTDHFRPQIFALWKSFIANGGQMKSSFEMTEQGTILSPGNLNNWNNDKIFNFMKVRLKIQQPIHDFEETKTADIYKKMIDSLTQGGTEICLVKFPLSPVFRQYLEQLPSDLKADWDAVDRFYKNLAIAQNVTYIDMTAYTDNLELYRDPDHLNASGAVLFGPELQ